GHGGWGHGACGHGACDCDRRATAWRERAFETTAQCRGHGAVPRPQPKQRWSAETTVHAQWVSALHRCFEALQCAHAPAFFRAFVMATLIWAKICGRKRSPNVRLKMVNPALVRFMLRWWFSRAAASGPSGCM